MRYHNVLCPSLFRSITHARHNLIHCSLLDNCTHFRPQCGILGLSKPSGEILGSDMCACRSVRPFRGWTTEGTEGRKYVYADVCLFVHHSIDRPRRHRRRRRRRRRDRDRPAAVPHANLLLTSETSQLSKLRRVREPNFKLWRVTSQMPTSLDAVGEGEVGVAREAA